MKKVLFTAIIVLTLFLTVNFLKNRKMDEDEIFLMVCNGTIECYDTNEIKQTYNIINELAKKKIQKRPEMDDATVLIITFENERHTESMQVEFTYWQKEIYLNIDENWYKTELSLEKVLELQEKLISKEND